MKFSGSDDSKLVYRGKETFNAGSAFFEKHTIKFN